MSVQVQQLRLELKHTFRIAHGSSTQRTNALIRIGSGVGEATLPPYYPTTLPDVAAYVESISEMLDDAFIRRELPVASIIDALPEGPSTARAAVDMTFGGSVLAHPSKNCSAWIHGAFQPAVMPYPFPKIWTYWPNNWTPSAPSPF